MVFRAFLGLPEAKYETEVVQRVGQDGKAPIGGSFSLPIHSKGDVLVFAPGFEPAQELPRRT